MKGITPVIAIILLLMITIAMVGFAFIWFSGIMESMTNQTGASISEEQRQMAINIQLINAYANPGGDVLVSFRNSGSQEIKANELVITVVDDSADSTLGTYVHASAIAPGGTVIDRNTTLKCTAENNLTLTASIPRHVDTILFQC